MNFLPGRPGVRLGTYELSHPAYYIDVRISIPVTGQPNAFYRGTLETLAIQMHVLRERTDRKSASRIKYSHVSIPDYVPSQNRRRMPSDTADID
jgi:hypothetical protein